MRACTDTTPQYHDPFLSISERSLELALLRWRGVALYRSGLGLECIHMECTDAAAGDIGDENRGRRS